MSTGVLKNKLLSSHVDRSITKKNLCPCHIDVSIVTSTGALCQRRTFALPRRREYLKEEPSLCHVDVSIPKKKLRSCNVDRSIKAETSFFSRSQEYYKQEHKVRTTMLRKFGEKTNKLNKLAQETVKLSKLVHATNAALQSPFSPLTGPTRGHQPGQSKCPPRMFTSELKQFAATYKRHETTTYYYCDYCYY